MYHIVFFSHYIIISQLYMHLMSQMPHCTVMLLWRVSLKYPTSITPLTSADQRHPNIISSLTADIYDRV